VEEIVIKIICIFLTLKKVFKLLEVNPEKDQKLVIKKNLRKLGQAPKQPGISYLEWNPINSD